MIAVLTRLFIITAVLIGINQAHGQVWAHSQTNKWSEETEVRFSNWVERDVNTDLLNKPGTFYRGLKIDCADLQYLLRLIFSYDNGLEFAINDPVNKGQILSSLSKRWQMYSDPQQRVRRFTEYILAVTSTRTLPDDTVLVAMSAQSIRPGVVLLGDRLRGHSMVIKKVNPSGVPKLLYASLPATEFIYLSYHFPDALGYFPMGSLTHAKGGGLRRFRWPSDLKKTPSNVLYASESQLTAGQNLSEYFDHVQKLVRIKPATADDTLNYLMDDLCAHMRVRVNTITDAVQFIRSVNGRRLTLAEEDRFSTYKRDQSIILLITQLEQKRRSLELNLSSLTKERYRRVFEPEGTTADECLVDWAVNRMEPLGWLIIRFKNQQISSHANDTLSRRWGL